MYVIFKLIGLNKAPNSYLYIPFYEKQPQTTFCKFTGTLIHIFPIY